MDRNSDNSDVAGMTLRDRSGRRPGTRRRWRYTWGSAWVGPLAGMWLLAGAPVILVLSLADADKNGDIARSARYWFLGFWLGPFGVALVIGTLYTIGCGLVWVWRHPPIRRETESVEDIREAYRDA